MYLGYQLIPKRQVALTANFRSGGIPQYSAYALRLRYNGWEFKPLHATEGGWTR